MTQNRQLPATLLSTPGETTGYWHSFLPVVGFYLAWAGLALLSHLLEQTTVGLAAAAFLVGGVVTTNLLLVVLNLAAIRSGRDSTLATAQAGLAVAWTTVYAVLGDGPGELVPAMYLTAVLTVFMRIDASQLRQLGLAAAAGYALSILVRLLASPWSTVIWGDLLQWLGVVGMLAILARRARQSEAERMELSAQVEKLQLEVERISRSAERDHLTKSFSRQYIMEALLREKARADRSGGSFSVCMFDLDRFKSLNDTHGHVAGDRALAMFSERARRALRAMDTINPTRHRRALGRPGGEEFLAVLPGTDIGSALRCAERVRDAVAREPVDDELRITVSAGVAEYRRGENIPDLLTRVDQAMYAAKRSGRNRVRVSASPPVQPKNDGSSKPKLRLVR